MYQAFKEVDIRLVLRDLHKVEFMDSGGVCAHVNAENKASRALVKLYTSLGLGGSPHRIFYRKLKPHQGINPHVDRHAWLRDHDIRRFHIPLVTHPDIIMDWPGMGMSTHLKPGWLYEVRYNVTHAVINDTDCERIHIQVDQIGATI